MTIVIYIIGGLGVLFSLMVGVAVLCMAWGAMWAEQPQNRGRGRVKDER